jgi:glycerol-3-phosphate dehydrogenase (NAD(P)+)
MSLPSVSVIGSGGWGTALALLMARQGLDVFLWGHDHAHVEAMRTTRFNEKYLPGVELPTAIHSTSSLSDCSTAGVIFIAVPSKHLASVAGEMAAAGVGSATTLVSCTKGIELGGGQLMSDVIAEKLPDRTIAALSGPNLAGEIARGLPAAGVIGCENADALLAIRCLFAGTSFRAYSSHDVRGIQLGGALKNIFAIGAGVSDGLGLGENARAGLVTRALAEMTRLGVAMGGHRETFCGLSGIGDLMLTCFSSQSRNHQVGFRLGRGEMLEEIIASMTMVAEGVPTTASAHACARRLGVETPIIDEVHAVLCSEKSPAEAIKALMSRELRSEES